jgi:hypothetical protein
MGIGRLSMLKDSNPYAPGESPFKVKGFSYSNTLACLGREVPGGLPALLAQVHDARLRQFLEQPFLDGTWYDVLPFPTMLHAASRLSELSPLELARKAAADGAEKNVKGIHRLLLQLTSPDQLIERLPAVAKQYLNFVTSHVERRGPSFWVSTADGIPSAIVHVYMTTTEAFTTRALELAGAKDTRQTWHPPKVTGQDRGITVVQAVREITWK